MKAAISPGMIFAGYRVEELVGRGGMGVVYRATDLSLERPVALKLVAPELAEDERFRERFLREPRLAASLDHPHVIPIYEAGEHDGQLYLAMRFVEGSDLRTILEREEKLSPERTLAVLAQVADALDAAHRRALVHRDVKPANVLLDEDGHAYLSDFGITKQVGGDSTDTGRVVGTLDYLAPEQIRGDPVDGRADVYALGCVLYECLAGVPPFRRPTEAEILWAHMQEHPAPLRGQPRLDPVLRKALAKNQEDRYGSCTELIDAAADALGLARAPRAARRSIVPPAVRRHGRAILAGGLLLLAATIALAIVALTGGEDGRVGPIGNGVAAIDPADGSVTSFTESETPPGNVAVGEGGVWVLDNEAKTVSRIDPDTKEVTETFDTPGVPSELAVGEGALWVGIAGGRGGTNATVSVARMDPDDGRVTGTARLRGDGGVYPVAGTPRVAVGAGCGLGRQPGRKRVPHRPEERATRGDDRDQAAGVDDRRRRRRRLVLGVRRSNGRHRDRHAQEPRGPDDPGRGIRADGGGRRRRLGLGSGRPRRGRLADHPRAVTGHEDDRRRQGSHVRHLRRGRRLDRQLRRRNGRSRRSRARARSPRRPPSALPRHWRPAPDRPG